jgi:exopolysaccharide biosynthesis protein
MKKAKMWVIIFLVFILGVLAGSLGMQQYIHYKISDFFRRGEHARVEALLARMAHDLTLTDSQKVEIKSILQESHNRIHKIKTQTDPQIRTIIDDSFRHIREKLNDDQKEKLDAFHEKLKKHKRPPPPF